jgi:peroxiredoxin
MRKRLSPRTTLIAITALFLLPLLLAWFMYSGAIEYKPSSTRNFGRLVEPPIPVAWEETVLIPDADEASSGSGQAFSEHWVVLYWLPDSCLEACFLEASALRQIHLASGRHQPRIRIALLIRDSVSLEVQATLRKIYPKFQLVGDPSGMLSAALKQAAKGKGRVYLIDPLGNIMMAYESGADPNHIRQDLKRLLTWSKLDEQ